MVPIEIEAWIWYGVVMLVVCTRLTSRYLQFGRLKKLQIEDLCMLLVAALYTIEVVLLVKAAFTPSNLVAPEDFSSLDYDNIQLRIYGSKLTIALEQVYCATIWGCKGCLLLCYSKLTRGLNQHFWVNVVAIYAFSGYLLMVILFFGVWCQPFYDYWSVPAENPQCSTYLHHLTVNMVLNVSSDLMMLLIPLPLLLRTQLPIRKKIILCFVFSLGIFCILSAVLNKYYSFASPYGSEWVYWYIREVSTAVIVANIPHCWSLMRRAFRLRSFVNNLNESSVRGNHRNKHIGHSPTIGGSNQSNHYSMPAFPAVAFSSRRWVEDLRSFPSDDPEGETEEMAERDITMVVVRNQAKKINRHDSQDMVLGVWDAQFTKFNAEDVGETKGRDVESTDGDRPSHEIHPVSRQELAIAASAV